MRISLIGMMGVGKTTVGQHLAEALQCEIIDLDAWVVAQAGMTIPEIFAQLGEAQFREWEWQALQTVTAQNQSPLVLSTGGGIVTQERCRLLLREHWHTVWLSASVETLESHLALNRDSRPLLQSASELGAHLDGLLQKRFPWYRETCREEVSVDDKSAMAVAQEILTNLERLQSKINDGA